MKSPLPHLKNFVTQLRSERYHLILLWIAAGASILIYLQLFVLPANLFRLYETPRLDVNFLFNNEPAGRTNLITGFILGAIFYVIGWFATRQLPSRKGWSVVWDAAILASWTLLFLYPFDSADIFDYIVHGRIFGLYQANPYIQVVDLFPDDPFFTYAAWKWEPAIYGPGWELAAGLTARIAGDEIWVNVLLFKLIPGSFYFASLLLIQQFMKKAAPERALSAAWLFAMNPVILYETFGNGHNDMTMIFWVLAAVWAIYARKDAAALVFLTAGFLFKFLPILLFPAAGFIALTRKTSLSAKIRYILIAGTGSFLLIIAAYAPFWEGPQVLTFLDRGAWYTTSLPAIIYQVVLPTVGKEMAAAWISKIANGLTVIFAFGMGWQAVRHQQKSPWIGFTEASIVIFLFYFLVTCTWFQVWYMILPASLAVILPAGWLQGLAVFCAFAVLSKPFGMVPILLWGQKIPQPIHEIRLTLGTFAGPWAAAMIASIASRKKHFDTKNPAQNSLES